MIFIKNIKRIYPGLVVKEDNKFIASKLIAMLDDMAFNLAPKADVYANADKFIEEAIACIEALARVPQQSRKWGDAITMLIMPKLYDIYYNQVIPANIQTYKNLTGETYLPLKVKEPNILKKIKNLFKKKAKYYKIWEIE